LIAGILDANRYDLEFATGGKDAVEAIEERSFDLILMDIMMPEITGYEACQLIKQHKNGKDTPIIFLTAKTDMESITQAFAVGGVDYITKPFNSDELLSRVKTHVELNRTRAQLEDLVALRTEELRVANHELTRVNKELEGLEEAKNEFINIISHEIRTPLNGIMGSLQLMQMDLNDSKTLNRMKLLHDSVLRLEKFSEKIILISELRSKRYSLQFETINLKQILNEVLEIFGNDIREKNIKVRLDVSDTLVAESDPYLLRVCIANLIENSLRLSQPESELFVSATFTGEQFAVAIEDQAGGVDEQLIAKLFRPFSMIEKFVNWNAGLGLYLVKLICENIAASIDFRNVNKGVRVCVEF